jgi:hypothetical protein
VIGGAQRQAHQVRCHQATKLTGPAASTASEVSAAASRNTSGHQWRVQAEHCACAAHRPPAR